jgi:cation diffusion facilitator family transporter
VDALNNLIGLIIIRYATAAPDARHPYGHRKIESLAAFTLGGLLLVTCVEIVSRAIQRLHDPSHIRVRVEFSTIVVLIGTILVNLAVFAYERRKGRELGSPLLLADSLHTRSDILVSGSLLLGLALMRWKEAPDPGSVAGHRDLCSDRGERMADFRAHGSRPH